MKDVLKNMFYTGAGAAFLTKEKLEELRTELIEKGKMTQDEGKQFIEDIVKKSEEAKSQLDKQIQETITAQLKNMDIASGDDITQLRIQIEELKAMIESKSAEG